MDGWSFAWIAAEQGPQLSHLLKAMMLISLFPSTLKPTSTPQLPARLEITAPSPRLLKDKLMGKDTSESSSGSNTIARKAPSTNSICWNANSTSGSCRRERIQLKETPVRLGKLWKNAYWLGKRMRCVLPLSWSLRTRNGDSWGPRSVSFMKCESSLVLVPGYMGKHCFVMEK